MLPLFSNNYDDDDDDVDDSINASVGTDKDNYFLFVKTYKAKD